MPESWVGTLPKVGILGGGQLSMMLADAAQGLGLSPTVLTASASDPAARRPGARVQIGSPSDPVQIAKLLEGTDVVAIESELVPQATLESAQALAEQKGQFATLLPRPNILGICGDKLQQKKALDNLGIPTATYEQVDLGMPERTDVERWTKEIAPRFGRGFVLKWATGGYDGRGTLVCASEEPPIDAMTRFLQTAARAGRTTYVEERIDFEFELAVVSVRSRRGEFTQYPAVLTRQEGGICVEVRGPAHAFSADHAVTRIAEERSRRIGEALDIVGTYAVEFFVRGHDVLVNEIAPRVHNSGHFSQDAAATSQFENHWRALIGLPLGPVTTRPYFAMLNVIGAHDLSESADPPLIVGQTPDLKMHWYGKDQIRRGRKLGHVNVAAEAPQELDERIRQVRQSIAAWHSVLARRSNVDA